MMSSQIVAVLAAVGQKDADAAKLEKQKKGGRFIFYPFFRL